MLRAEPRATRCARRQTRAGSPQGDACDLQARSAGRPPSRGQGPARKLLWTPEPEGFCMADGIFVAVTVAFFALSIAYVYGCERV
jgi:hypothetical protein